MMSGITSSSAVSKTIYLRQLDQSLDRLSADAVRRNSARRLISKINEVTLYDDLYGLLGFEFVLDPRGNPGLLNREAFDLVVSVGVLEHIHAKDATDLFKAWRPY